MNTDVILGTVVYTDGSANPNPGHTGWGFHGFLYKIIDPESFKKPTIINNNVITHCGYKTATEFKQVDINKMLLSGPFGIDSILNEKLHIPVHPYEYFDGFGSDKLLGTNNKAEITAVLESLKYLKDKSVKLINILTDSQYTQNGIKYKKQNKIRIEEAKKQSGVIYPIPNQDLWIELYDVLDEYEKDGIEIRINWVSAHNGVMGNTQANILAYIGSNHARDSIHKKEIFTSEAKKYWKPDINKHPFLIYRELYFNSVTEYNVPGQYYQADSGVKDLTIGRRTPGAGFSVIRLKEPEEPIEIVKQKQFKVSNRFNSIFMLKVDKVYDKFVHPYLMLFGGYCLNRYRKNNSLIYSDNTSITVEQNPTGLSLRAIESFAFLEEILDKSIQLTNGDSNENIVDNFDTQCLDVTELFYETVEKKVKAEVVIKKQLRSEYIVGFRDMIIKVFRNDQQIDVPIILGLDMPPRNNLKRLEDLNPSVYLITWSSSERTMRYAVYIKCDDAVGIWSNFFSDMIITKGLKNKAK